VYMQIKLGSARPRKWFIRMRNVCCVNADSGQEVYDDI
jgi:hypothetical protein